MVLKWQLVMSFILMNLILYQQQYYISNRIVIAGM